MDGHEIGPEALLNTEHILSALLHYIVEGGLIKDNREVRQPEILNILDLVKIKIYPTFLTFRFFAENWETTNFIHKKGILVSEMVSLLHLFVNYHIHASIEQDIGPKTRAGGLILANIVNNATKERDKELETFCVHKNNMPQCVYRFFLTFLETKEIRDNV